MSNISHHALLIPLLRSGRVLLAASLSCLHVYPAQAEETTGETRPEFLFFDATQRYAPPSGVSGGESGRTGTREVGTLVSLTKGRVLIPISSEFILLTGPEWSLFEFDGASGPIPERLHRVVWQVGGIYRPGGETTYFLLFYPGLYSDLQDISSDDLSFTGLISASTRLSSSFDLQYGLRFSYAGEYPLIPVAGFRWRASDQWTVNMTAPLAEILWNPTDKWQLSLGFGLDGSTFRMSKDYGSEMDRKDLSNIWLNYREIRTFLALERALVSGFTLRLEAGWYLNRKFTFDDRIDDVTIDGSGYAGLQLRWAF